MSLKSIVIKAIAGLTATVLLLAAVWFMMLPEESEKKEKLSVYSADVKSVTAVEVTANEHFELKKSSDKRWTMDQMEEIAVNGAFANTLEKSVTEISAEMLVEENAEDFAIYGLDKPKARVKIKFGQSFEEILVGNPSGEYYYLTVASDRDVYIVKKSDLYMVFLEKIKYLDNTAFAAKDIVKIIYGDVALEKKNGEWQELLPYNRPADAAVVEKRIVKPLEKITATEIVRCDTLTLDGGTNVKVTSEDGEEQIFTFYAQGYITKPGCEYAFKIEEPEFINLSGFDVMSKYIAPINIREVSSIKLVEPKTTNILEIEAPQSAAPDFYKNGSIVSEVSFKDFYQKLVGLTVKAEGSGNGAAEYAVVFTKENGEIYDVRFVKSDEDDDYGVSINGKTEFTVSKKAVTDLFFEIKNIY